MICQRICAGEILTQLTCSVESTKVTNILQNVVAKCDCFDEPIYWRVPFARNLIWMVLNSGVLSFPILFI